MSTPPKVALLTACLIFGPPVSVSNPKPANIHTVTIENMQFSPDELTVASGDRVVWVNKDLFPHTATAREKAFDSGSINSGGTWTFKTQTSGDYSYGCTFHPIMKAIIHVH